MNCTTLTYCKKCGTIGQFGYGKNAGICGLCGSKEYVIPDKYLDKLKCFVKDKQLLIEELVKPSPEFDQYLFDHSDEILAQKNEEYNNSMEVGRALLEGRKVSRREILSGKLNDSPSEPTITCPYCKSTNTTKISTTSKVINTALFGVFGTKRYKNYHCNKCGSDF